MNLRLAGCLTVILWGMGAGLCRAQSNEAPPLLIGHWTFDNCEWSSPTSCHVTDESGFHDPLILENARFSQAAGGKSVYFDGANTVGSFGSTERYLELTKTISFWFVKENNGIENAPGSPDREGLVVRATGLFADRASELIDYAIFLEGRSAPFTLGVFTNTAANQTEKIWLQKSIRPGVWYMVTVVLGERESQLFLNGTLVGSTTMRTPPNSSSVRSIIGDVPKAKRGSGRFQGSIDDLRIYEGTLTAQEVTELFHKTYR